MVTHKKTLLTERETAAFLGVSVSLIRKWRVEGQGGPDYFKIARAVRYDEDAIKSFLEVRRVSGNHGRVSLGVEEPDTSPDLLVSPP